MEKFKLIKEMLGDDVAGFIAADLRESYYDIVSNDSEAPLFSHDPEEDLEEKLVYLQALRKVYTWYATGHIDSEEITND